MLDPRAARRAILRMAHAGNYGHLGPSLSIVEILCAIDRMAGPNDRILLSKGHGVQAQYAIRYLKGDLSDADLDGFLSDGSALRGVSEFGALGHGLSIAVGTALAQRDAPKITFVVCGDGEMNEGACWEAVALAGQLHLGKLFLFVDANGFQAMGPTRDVIDQSALARQIESFGWLVDECQDGNSVEAIVSSVKRFANHPREYLARTPKAIICKTAKGHGVSFMRNDNDWHYRKLTPDLFAAAMKELGASHTGESFS